MYEFGRGNLGHEKTVGSRYSTQLGDQCRHAENCKEEKNENRGHSALSRELKQRERVIRPCRKSRSQNRRAEVKKPFRRCEKNTSESFSLRRCNPCEDREKHSECESEKKKEIFFFNQVTHKENH